MPKLTIYIRDRIHACLPDPHGTIRSLLALVRDDGYDDRRISARCRQHVELLETGRHIAALAGLTHGDMLLLKRAYTAVPSLGLEEAAEKAELGEVLTERLAGMSPGDQALVSLAVCWMRPEGE